MIKAMLSNIFVGYNLHNTRCDTRFMNIRSITLLEALIPNPKNAPIRIMSWKKIKHPTNFIAVVRYFEIMVIVSIRWLLRSAQMLLITIYVHYSMTSLLILQFIVFHPDSVANETKIQSQSNRDNTAPFTIIEPHSYQTVPVPMVHRVDSDIKVTDYDLYVYDPSKFTHFKPEIDRCLNPQCNHVSASIAIILIGLMDVIGLGPSWNAWMETQRRTYISNGAANGSIYLLPSLKLLVDAWNSFVCCRQNWGYRYTCPFCDRGGDQTGECDEVGYDGMICYLKRFRAGSVSNATTVHDETSVVKNKLNKSNRYIQNYQTRLLCQRWYQTHFTKYPRENKLDPLKPQEANALKRKLQQNEQLSRLKCLMDWIEQNENTLSMRHHKSFHRSLHHVIRAIVSDEACYKLMHGEINNIFLSDAICYSDHRRQIKKYSPLLHRLLFHSDALLSACKEIVLDILKDMASYSSLLLTEMIAKQQHPEQIPTDDQKAQYNNWMRSGSYYAATKQRNRPLYKTDQSTEKDENVCSKDFK
eukprot:278886_1